MDGRRRVQPGGEACLVVSGDALLEIAEALRVDSGWHGISV